MTGSDGRVGMDVYPDEIQRGDLVADRGTLRRVSLVSGDGYSRDSVRLLFSDGALPPYLAVPREVKIHVRRLPRGR